MEADRGLLELLKEYGASGRRPFHMPGHKRMGWDGLGGGFPDPYTIDITEIEGFDNLHHPQGILRDLMESAARLYGSDRTYYLVNGSTGGILSAVCGTVRRGGTILMARNCHKSAYHAAMLQGLHVRYVYAKQIPGWGLQGGIDPEDVELALERDRSIQAVLLVSPTYDGVVSDVGAIAGVVHKFGLPLIVDEAHGAHFSFGGGFPESALNRGADVVVQSLHKTLPALTQTAVLHIRGERAGKARIERCLAMFQSSSPSYVLMASADACIRLMGREGRERNEMFFGRLSDARERLEMLRNLRLFGRGLAGTWGVFDIDPGRIVISCRAAGLRGERLAGELRRLCRLEPEMCGADYVTFIATIADTKESLQRLTSALLEWDRKAAGDKRTAAPGREIGAAMRPETAMTLAEAAESPSVAVPLGRCAGRVSAEFIYLYPPGIPIVAPGEVISIEALDTVAEYLSMGLPVQGPEDVEVKSVSVVL